MQPSPLNIMVFDEGSSFQTEKSRGNMHRNPSHQSFNQSELINTQLTLLADRIQQLQQQSIRLHDSTQVKSCKNTESSARDPQVDELLKVIEKKIKIIVRETKNIVEKLVEEIEKKINQTANSKNHEANAITKIQNHCRETIIQIENRYQKDLHKVREQHQQYQHQMVKRVQQLEVQYRNQMESFAEREKEYVEKIQHLQQRIRQVQKNKKMIEVTQEKSPSKIQPSPSQNLSANLSGPNPSNPSMAIPSPNDTSKRRHKIFDSKNSNRSVSPNQVLSPNQKTFSNKAQSLAKLEPKEEKSEKANLFYSKNTNEHLNKNRDSKFESQVNNFPISGSRQTAIKPQPQKSRQDIRQIEEQFYRDLPRATWERFQDFDQNNSSGSEDDVFFYPQRTQREKSEPKVVYDYENEKPGKEEKMFSPFDVN